LVLPIKTRGHNTKSKEFFDNSCNLIARMMLRICRRQDTKGVARIQPNSPISPVSGSDTGPQSLLNTSNGTLAASFADSALEADESNKNQLKAGDGGYSEWVPAVIFFRHPPSRRTES
jgi:hypothetical protein